MPEWPHGHCEAQFLQQLDNGKSCTNFIKWSITTDAKSNWTDGQWSNETAEKKITKKNCNIQVQNEQLCDEAGDENNLFSILPVICIFIDNARKKRERRKTKNSSQMMAMEWMHTHVI